MAELSWSERQIVDELAGALTGFAALVAFRPEIRDRIQAAVVASLGDAEREMVEKLVDPARLLPSGGEVSTQWSVRKDDPWGVRVVMEPSTEEEAREYFADQLRFEEGSHRRPAELVHRQVTTWEDGSEHYTPWSPVLSDNSEKVEDHAD